MYPTRCSLQFRQWIAVSSIFPRVWDNIHLNSSKAKEGAEGCGSGATCKEILRKTRKFMEKIKILHIENKTGINNRI
jgi:hypothetical protein